MSDNTALVDQLSNLTVLQIADLVKALEEKWGVSAAAPVAVAAAGGAAAGFDPIAGGAQAVKGEAGPAPGLLNKRRGFDRVKDLVN